MASSSRLPLRQEWERLEGVEVGWRPDTRRHRRWQVYRFDPQNRVAAGSSVRPSKPGGGRFAGLGLKTASASDVAGWRLRRARGVIAKLAPRRSEVVKAVCPSGGPIKNLTVLPLRGI